uniref:SGNH hydrolase-type esterase domain-containing protein n=1 Tax=Salix viminalis TaxID=40686 RepID=A0A6N2LKU2_SALVM
MHFSIALRNMVKTLTRLFDCNFAFLCEGFEEVKKACCGSGPFRGSITCGQKVYQLCDNVSEYFFFDGIHPTEKANYQFAKLMWDGTFVYQYGYYANSKISSSTFNSWKPNHCSKHRWRRNKRYYTRNYPCLLESELLKLDGADARLADYFDDFRD